MSARERQTKTAGTDYGAGIISTKGNLTVGGQSYTNLNYDDTLKAYQHMNAWRDSRGLTTKNSRAETEKLKTQLQTLEGQHMMERYMEMMGEYMGAMSEAMNREEPAAEPLKAAADATSAARADTARKQLLRRGLMSTYTRLGGQGAPAQKLGA